MHQFSPVLLNDLVSDCNTFANWLLNLAEDLVCWINDTRLDLDGGCDGDGRHTLDH